MGKSIYHSQAIYNCLKNLRPGLFLSDVHLKHIMAVLTAVFMQGFHGKTASRTCTVVSPIHPCPGGCGISAHGSGSPAGFHRPKSMPIRFQLASGRAVRLQDTHDHFRVLADEGGVRTDGVTILPQWGEH